MALNILGCDTVSGLNSIAASAKDFIMELRTEEILEDQEGLMKQKKKMG
jgi:hypothetical protein